MQKPKWDEIENLFNDRGYSLISTEYINAKTPLEYECPKHGLKKIRYGNLKAGFGCPDCGNERIGNKKRKSFDDVKKIFEDHDMILLEQEYKNAHTPLMYICKHHPEVGIQYMALTNARVQRCPYCHKSKGELAISQFLIDNKIEFTPQKKFDDLSVGSKGKLSYDFYIHNTNILIEYQGEQHEHPVDIFGGENAFKDQLRRDSIKRNYALDHGYELIEIWYYDYDEIENILYEKIFKEIA